MHKVNIGFWIKFRKLEKAFNKLKERKQRIANLHKCYNTREDHIQLYNGYAALACEAKYRGMEGEETKAASEAGAMKWQRTKIPPSKQLLKRLLILLSKAQVRNTSKDLLN